jgi:hypothetical protein
MALGLSESLTAALKGNENALKSIGDKTKELTKEMEKGGFPIVKINGEKTPLIPLRIDPEQQAKIMKATETAAKTIDKLAGPLMKSMKTMLEKTEDGTYTMNTDNVSGLMEKSFGKDFKSMFDFPAGSSIGGSTSLATDALNRAKDLADFSALQSPAIVEGMQNTVMKNFNENLPRMQKEFANVFKPSNMKKLTDTLDKFKSSGFLSMNLPDMPALPNMKDMFANFPIDKLTANSTVEKLSKALNEVPINDLKSAFDTMRTKLTNFITISDGEDPNDDGFT